MKVISDKHKFILVCTPKTASSSMRSCLSSMGMRTTSGINFDKPASLIKQKHPLQWNNYLTAGFCRNPFDRFVSLFYDFKNLRGLIREDFEEWVCKLPVDTSDNIWAVFKPQKWYLAIDNKVAVKFLGRYETLNEDWQKLGGKIGLSLPTLQITRESGHPPYRDLYNQKTVRIIAEIYKEDFELFGYDANI